MTSRPVPRSVLSDLAAAWVTIERCRKPNAAAAIVLRLSVDRSGEARLEARELEGITLRAIVEVGHEEPPGQGQPGEA